jgi:hypothetical protein
MPNVRFYIPPGQRRSKSRRPVKKVIIAFTGTAQIVGTA